MTHDGIFIYADDAMLNQFIALANSILLGDDDTEGIPNKCYPIVVVPHSAESLQIKELIDEYRTKGLNISILSSDLIDTAAMYLIKTNEYLSYLCERAPAPYPQFSFCSGNFSRFAVFDDQFPFDRFLVLDCDIVIRKPNFFWECFECLAYESFLSLDHFYKLSPTLLKYRQKHHQAEGHRDSHLFCVGAFGATRHYDVREILFNFSFKDSRDAWRSLVVNAPEQTILERIICSLPEDASMSYKYDNCQVWTHGTLMECVYPPEARSEFVHWMGVPNVLFNDLFSHAPFIPHSDVYSSVRYLNQL